MWDSQLCPVTCCHCAAPCTQALNRAEDISTEQEENPSHSASCSAFDQLNRRTPQCSACCMVLARRLTAVALWKPSQIFLTVESGYCIFMFKGKRSFYPHQHISLLDGAINETRSLLDFLYTYKSLDGLSVCEVCQHPRWLEVNLCHSRDNTRDILDA
jgi:hypothetical protein